MTVEIFDSESALGYKQITTFYSDFSIAERSQSIVDAVTDTYKRAFKEWKSNYKYFTELVMVLNWKCWRWYDIGAKKGTIDKPSVERKMCELYQDLFYEARDYALDNLKGEELKYFLDTTD